MRARCCKGLASTTLIPTKTRQLSYSRYFIYLNEELEIESHRMTPTSDRGGRIWAIGEYRPYQEHLVHAQASTKNVRYTRAFEFTSYSVGLFISSLLDKLHLVKRPLFRLFEAPVPCSTHLNTIGTIFQYPDSEKRRSLSIKRAWLQKSRLYGGASSQQV
jgi:hypothetical protein